MKIQTIRVIKRFLKYASLCGAIIILVAGFITRGDLHDVVAALPGVFIGLSIVAFVCLFFNHLMFLEESKILLTTKDVLDNFKKVNFMGILLSVAGSYNGRKIKGAVASKRGYAIGDPYFFRFTITLDYGRFVIFKRINENIYISGTVMYFDVATKNFSALRDLSYFVAVADEYERHGENNSKCCGIRSDIIGTYKGDEQSNHREAIAENELRGDIGRRIASVPFGPNVYKCAKCGQYWIELSREGGHGDLTYFQKITLDEFKRKYPNAKFK